MNRINALIVSGGGFSGLGLIKGLRISDKVKIVVADCNEESIGSFFSDKYYQISRIVEKDAFLKDLYWVCNKEYIDIIIPATDHELTIISEEKKELNKLGIRVAVSDAPVLELIRNKLTLNKFLLDHKLPVPRSFSFNELNEFPVIGKPVYGFGSNKLVIIKQKDDYEKLNTDILNKNYIWQEFFEHYTEYSIDFAINFNKECSDHVTRERILTSGGYAVITRGVQKKEIDTTIQLLKKLLAENGGCGIFNVQVILNNNKFYITDVNPRFGTSGVFSHRLNVSLPLYMCSFKMSSFLNYGKLKEEADNYKMVRYLEEFWIKTDKFQDIQGVVFDLDETLIQQKRWIADKLDILWEKKSDILPEKDIFMFHALRLLEEGNKRNLFDLLAEYFRFDHDLKYILIEAYRDCIPDECYVYSDVIPSIEKLQSMGMKLGILTDNPPVSQEKKIQVSGLKKYFDSIFYTRNTGNEKPDTGGFNEIAKNMSIDINKLAMVGDNVYRDLAGAYNSGYNGLFLLQRKGGFTNFNDHVFKKAGLNFNIIHLNNLNDIFIYI